MRSAYRVVVGSPEEKRPLGSPRCKSENNIKMYLREQSQGVDWIYLDQNRDRWRALLNTVMILVVS
jgi:hypothetical protein